MNVKELVKQAQNGDQNAFQEVCVRFTGLVKKYAKQNHLYPIAREAESQGWLAVVEAVKTYDEASGVHFAGYVDSKVKFSLWNLFKKERRIWQEEQLEGGAEPEEGSLFWQLPDPANVEREVENRCLSRELRILLDALPDKQRQVIIRTVLGQESMTSMARTLGISAQAVYNLRQRGLARLKKRYAGMYESERG